MFRPRCWNARKLCSSSAVPSSVAFLPVFLLWTYVLWLVVLFGVEVAWLVQHHGSLVDHQRRVAADPRHGRRSPDGPFALSLMVTITDRFLHGGGGIGVEELVA